MKLKSYLVYGIVKMDVSISIRAASFEDAVLQSKKLQETDFCKPLGDYNDGRIDIEGIHDESVGLEDQ